VTPAFSYQGLQEILDDENACDEFKSIVMLNCGALIDWTEFWFTDETKDIQTYVIDSHRPYHHNNVHTSK